MTDALVAIILGLLGLFLGSFAGASVWRLRARQLKQDHTAGDKSERAEYKRLVKLTKDPILKDRSRCLHCDYVLRWYDLIPLVSWASLRGKCRNCRKPIGWFEPLIELGTAIFFVVSFVFWPTPLETTLHIAQLAVWLVAGIGLAILFAYDMKWFLLPDKVNFAVIGLGVVAAALTIVSSPDPLGAVISVVGSVGVLSGLYLVLHLISGGRWVGFGDIKLGLGLGLLLGNLQLAVVGLFAANLVGTLIVLPLLVTGKLDRKARVPFGPLLIVGTVIAQLAGPSLFALYMTTLI